MGLSNEDQHKIIIAVIVVGLMIVAYYLSSTKSKFTVTLGGFTHEEEAALKYYRDLAGLRCSNQWPVAGVWPEDGRTPLWGLRTCTGPTLTPLLVLHSDGDVRMEGIFVRAITPAPVMGRIVRGLGPSWIHNVPSVWMLYQSNIWRYGGELCEQGIRDFAVNKYAAELPNW